MPATVDIIVQENTKTNMGKMIPNSSAADQDRSGTDQVSTTWRQEEEEEEAKPGPDRRDSIGRSNCATIFVALTFDAWKLKPRFG